MTLIHILVHGISHGNWEQVIFLLSPRMEEMA